MSLTEFASMPLNAATDVPAGINFEWLWQGYIGRGNLTMLTSLWKNGKTTMITGLLQRMEADGEFLGRPCRAAKPLIVSEESAQTWARRLELLPVGPHVQLIPQPFLRRPTVAEWEQLVEHAGERHAAGQLDFFIVDSLRTFLPGASESDPGTVLSFLQPLQRLAVSGVAVLIIHHPRKERSEEGSCARGTGAMLGFVDIIFELHRFGSMASDENRRKIIGLSRFVDTPTRLNIAWDRATGKFTVVKDLEEARFRDNWDKVKAILQKRTVAATHHELLADWPSSLPAPAVSVLYEWLNRAYDKKWVRRCGEGRRKDPYRYRLPNEDDAYYDRGELPPIREPGPLFGNRE
jgi:AAA domain